MKRITSIALLAIALGVYGAWAAVPQTMSYQGVLTDGAGTAVPNGPYDLTFKIYDAASSGSVLWTESQNSVQVTGGIFNVTLGSVAPLNINFDIPYWLSVSVNGGAELSPRRELSSSPYSLNSQAVKGSDNVFPSSGNVGIGTISPAEPLTVKFDNTISNNPAIAIDNDAGPAGQDVIGFKMSGSLQASLRKPNSGDLFVTSSNGIIFQGSNTNRMRILSTGNVGIGTDTPVEQLDVAGGLKIGTSAGSNAGTLRWTGSDFEGYDGGTWKSLTATGGSSLPSGSAGQTLRHNGSDWVTSSYLFNDGAHVGIGTTTPDAALDIAGGQWDLTNTNGDVKIGDDSYKLKVGIATGGGGAGTAGIRVQGGLQRLILGGGSKEVVQVDTTGTVSIGSSSLSGALQVYMNGAASRVASLGPYGSYGGSVQVYDEIGNATAGFEPDVNGSGGYFFVARSPSYSAFVVDGNYNDTGNPLVTIAGDSKSASFNMNAADGNSSVVLPSDAVSSSEILDEPGTASATNNSGISLDGTVQTLLSRTITVPAAGYVLVMGTAQASIFGNASNTNIVTFGVSASNSVFPSNQTVHVGVPDGVSTSYFFFPVTCHGLFQVSAGSNTFYFLAQKNSYPTTVAWAYYTQLTVLYIPTSYGTVTPTLAIGNVPDDQQPKSFGLSASDIASEQIESERTNQERIEKELAEMKAKLAAVEELLRRENNK